MDFDKLPNALIIGAAKAGTTSLYSILAQHKQVFTSKKKETWFFSNDDIFNKGGDWYQETYFADADGYSVRMEASPTYLLFSDKVSARIHEFYQNHAIKFIAIFRDPVQRAYSNYWHHVRLGHEPLSFAEAIYAEETRLKENWDSIYYHGKPRYGYFRGGNYATRLKSFLNIFPRDRFFFLLQEDLQNDFTSRIADLLTFLELENTDLLRPRTENESKKPSSRAISRVYKWSQKLEASSKSTSFATKRLREWIRRAFPWESYQYPPMDTDIEEYLRSQYLPEIKELEPLINRDLSDWYARGPKKAALIE